MTAARALKPPTPPEPHAVLVPLEDLSVDRDWNIRTDPDPTKVAAIRGSMLDRLGRGLHPQEAPIWVTTAADRYSVVAGFTRELVMSELSGELTKLADAREAGALKDKELEAAALLRPEAMAWAQHPTAWVLLQDVEDSPAARRLANLAENMQRAELHPADLAVGLAEVFPADGLKPAGGPTAVSVAATLGISQSHARNLARVGRVLNLPQLGALRRGGITLRDAIRLASMEDAERAAAWQVWEATGKLPGPVKPPKPAAAPSEDNGDEDDGQEDGGDETNAKDLQARAALDRLEQLPKLVGPVFYTGAPVALALQDVRLWVFSPAAAARHEALDRLIKLLNETAADVRPQGGQIDAFPKPPKAPRTAHPKGAKPKAKPKVPEAKPKAKAKEGAGRKRGGR